MLLSKYKFAHLFNMSCDILLMSHNIASTLYYKKEQAKNDLLSAIGLSEYSQSVLNWKKVSYSFHRGTNRLIITTSYFSKLS